MKRFCIALAAIVILALAASDAIWPAELPLQIDARGSGSWQPIDEPDAGPATWPTDAAASADPAEPEPGEPALLVTICITGPQNLPLINPDDDA